MDPATLALNCATALTAALTLLFSRLDSHRQSSKEQFNLWGALADLSFALKIWTRNAEQTNQVMHSWAQGDLKNDEAAKRIRGTLLSQQSAADRAFVYVYGEDDKNDEPGRRLRHLLDIYGPEVLDVLKTGMAQRRELLDELIAEFPHLQANPEVLQATLTRLESTCQELNHALMQLNAYIREHWPDRVM